MSIFISFNIILRIKKFKIILVAPLDYFWIRHSKQLLRTRPRDHRKQSRER
jgi:hypothetical protein